MNKQKLYIVLIEKKINKYEMKAKIEKEKNEN